MSSFHTGIAVTNKRELSAIQVPTVPTQANEVRIKVEYSVIVAFDKYVLDEAFPGHKYPVIPGLNASGTVVECGSNVNILKVGDRVAAYTFGSNEHKGMQEYVTLPTNVVAKIPPKMALSEAATVPNTFATAFYTLFHHLELPIPPVFPVAAGAAPPRSREPILVFGASSATGRYIVQLLRLAGYTNVIATASARNQDFLRSLGSAHVVDYNSPTLVADLRSASDGASVRLAVDCISEEDSTLSVLGQVMSPHGRLAVLLPIKGSSDSQTGMLFDVRRDKTPFPEGMELRCVRTFNYQQVEYLRDHMMSDILPAILSTGQLQTNPVHLVEEGSFKDRVEEGFGLLETPESSGKRVVVRVVD